MKRYAARRDAVEGSLIATAEALGGLVIQEPPFDFWLYGRNTCRCGASGFRLIEVKDPKKEGWKNEYTDAQVRLIIRLNELQVPWHTVRTESDILKLLGAQRSA